MRRDHYLYNDSGVVSVLSRSVVGVIAESLDANGAMYAEKGQAILIGLAGDDSPIIRIVCGEPLSPAESEQWIARFTGRLVLTDGKLVVAGGFDPDQFCDLASGELDAEEAFEVDVPPDTYLVDVYTHAPSMSGGLLFEKFLTPLGRWFRSENPDTPMPGWIAGRLRYGAEEEGMDPGHEALWENPSGAIADGSLVLADATGYVGYVIHLREDDESATLDSPDEDGIFEYDRGVRTPRILPLGIVSEVVDPDLESELESLRADD